MTQHPSFSWNSASWFLFFRVLGLDDFILQGTVGVESVVADHFETRRKFLDMAVHVCPSRGLGVVRGSGSIYATIYNFSPWIPQKNQVAEAVVEPAVVVTVLFLSVAWFGRLDLVAVDERNNAQNQLEALCVFFGTS